MLCSVCEDVIAVTKSTAILNVVRSVVGLVGGDGRPFDSLTSDLCG